MSYLLRLQQVHALTLSGEKIKSELMVLFKCMHGVNGMSVGELGIQSRGKMNAVGKSRFRSIGHAQRQSVHYLNIVESMNGTTYILILAVFHY